MGYGSGMPSMTGKSTSATVAATALATPTSLTATAAAATTGTMRVNLAWFETSTTQSGFAIQRATESRATFTQLATVAANTVSYAYIAVTVGATHQYRVAGATAAGNSAWSNEATVTVTAAPTVPAVPTILTGTSVRTGTTQTGTTTWTAVPGATGYRIHRSLTGNRTALSSQAAKGWQDYRRDRHLRAVR